MARLDFWFDFASAYSYPAAMRIETMASRRGVEIRWRPFLLGPIFAEQGWNNSPFNLYPVKGRYMWRDLEHICAAEALPFARPPRSRTRSASGLATFAAQFGKGVSIAAAENLAPILAGEGLPAAALEQAEAAETKAALKAAVDEAKSLGVFGAPSFTTPDGELFRGFDRLLAALDWTAARS